MSPIFLDFRPFPTPCYPFYYIGLCSNITFWQISPSLLSGWRHLCSLCWVFFSCLDCMWKWKLFFRVNVPILTQLLAKDVQLQKFSNLIVLRSQMLDTNIPDIQILTVGANFFFCEKIAFKYLHIIHHPYTTLQKFKVYALWNALLFRLSVFLHLHFWSSSKKWMHRWPSF